MKKLESEDKKKGKREESSIFYPVLSFLTKPREEQQWQYLFVLHSWDFSEFQNQELAKLLMCQRQRFLHNSDLGITKEQQPYFDFLGNHEAINDDDKLHKRIGRRKNMMRAKIDFLRDQQTRIQEDYNTAFSNCVKMFQRPKQGDKLEEKAEEPSKKLQQQLKMLETFKFFLQHDSHVEAKALGCKCIFDQVWQMCGVFFKVLFFTA